MNIVKLIMLIDSLPKSGKYKLYNAIYPLVNTSSDNVVDYLEDIREAIFASKPHCPH